MRRPLDELVAGDPQPRRGPARAAREPVRTARAPGPRRRVQPMGEDLATAQHRIEEERRRLAVTIESLGDALIVTEPGSSTIADRQPARGRARPRARRRKRRRRRGQPAAPRAVGAAPRDADRAPRALAGRDRRPASAAHSDGVVWTVRDMSERARLERAKSEFVATASHELRSPLTSIKGFVELLQRSPESMSDRQREFVDIILKSTDRLVELVNDLLDVARIEADHVEINRRPIDVGEVVHEVVELMEPRDARQAPAAQLLRRADAAARARRSRAGAPDRGQPADQRAPVHARGRQHPRRRRARPRLGADRRRGLRRRDDRRGGFASVRPLLPRRQPERIEPGTGLGLSIVKSLVDLHYGQISVESEPGRGIGVPRAAARPPCRGSTRRARSSRSGAAACSSSTTSPRSPS